jgi:8-oxo-dGTP diphosphatase
VVDADEGVRPECAAGALFVDEGGDVLLVEPTYKAMWEIPGGQMQVGETPREACARELQEEFGLELPIGRLLVVDWAPHVREERVRFVFDGGVLTDEQLDAIELPPHELESWAFIAPGELFVMLEPRLSRRVTAALAARESGTTLYLEHGVPISPE